MSDQGDSGTVPIQRDPGQSEGVFLASIVFGGDPFYVNRSDGHVDPYLGLLDREGAPEPTLLPHLPRLIHDFSNHPLAQLGSVLGQRYSPQLWESTLLSFVRHGEGPHEAWMVDPHADDPELELDVFRAVHNEGSSSGLLSRIDAVDPQRQLRLRARLAELLGPGATENLLQTPGSDEMPAEPTRSLLAAANRFGLTIDSTWLESALEADEHVDYFPHLDSAQVGRLMHLLPVLPGPRCTQVADAIAEMTCAMTAATISGDWYVALIVSQTSSYTSDPSVWDNLVIHEDPWHRFIPTLITSPRVSPDEAVRRSHPFRAELASVEARHETTERTPDAMSQWIPLLAQPSMVAPPEPPPRVVTAPAPIPVPEPTRSIDPIGPPGSSPGPNPPPAPPGSVQPGPAAPRTLQADVVVAGQKRQHTFAAGVVNAVRFSIGRRALISAGVAFPDVDPQGADEVELPVWVHGHGQTTHGSILLPTDDALDSNWIPFDFTPPVGETFVEIVVVIYSPDGADVLEAGTLMGAVIDAAIDDDSQTQEQLHLERTDVRRIREAPPAADFASVVHSGQTVIVNDPIAADANDQITIGAATETATARIRDFVTAIQARAQSIHADLEDTRRTIVDAARFGARLLTEVPNVGRLRSAERVQVVSLANSVILPLELIYDATVPREDATVCATWQEALLTGQCPTCGDARLDDTRVCPLRFWSMSKIIEHHGPSSSDRRGTFSARSVRSGDGVTLAPFTNALIAASQKISEQDPTLVPAVEQAGHALGIDVEVASDWDAWRAAVERSEPSLLIAMAHQETTDERIGTAANLEIGGQLENIFDHRFVRISSSTSDATAPGPVVMLLGCNTAVDPRNNIASLGSIFRGQGASAVVSSLGEIIATEAPGAATLLLTEMSSAMEQPGATLGSALRLTRQRLLADNNVLGFMLVMHGQSDWMT